MRIIAGQWKGKSLVVPREGTRPSTDRTRQALFSILQNVTEGAQVLDLYAGSGALALECLSRGARSAVAVDSERVACSLMQRSSRALGTSSLTVTQSEVLPFLTRSKGQAFDLVFADPPYERDFSGSQLQQALCHPNLPSLLAPEALFIAESPRPLTENELSELPAYWELLKARKYGKSSITVFRHTTPPC